MTEKEIKITSEQYQMILFCIGYTMGAEYEKPNGPYEHEDYQKTTDEIIEAWVNSE